MNKVRNIGYAMALAVLLPLAAAGEERGAGGDVPRTAGEQARQGVLVEQRLDQLNKELQQGLELRIQRQEAPGARPLSGGSLAKPAAAVGKEA